MPPMTRSRSCAQPAIEKLRVGGGRRCHVPNTGEKMKLCSCQDLLSPPACCARRTTTICAVLAIRLDIFPAT